MKTVYINNGKTLIAGKKKLAIRNALKKILRKLVSTEKSGSHWRRYKQEWKIKLVRNFKSENTAAVRRNWTSTSGVVPRIKKKVLTKK